MSEPLNSADFQTAEVFSVADRRSKTLSQLATPQMIIFPLVLSLLLWFILNGLLLPAFGVPEHLCAGLALILTIVVIPGLIAARLGQLLQGFKKVYLQADPQGMTYRDGSITRVIAWNDMTGIGVVKPLRGVEMSAGGSSANAGQAVAKGVNRLAQQLSGSYGVLGRGTATPESNLAAKILQQNHGVWGRDTHGTPLVGIAPADIAKDWFSGRMGAWLRHYRPDLAAAYEQELAKR